MALILKGLGECASPKTFKNLSLADYSEAFGMVGNYRNMPLKERTEAIEQDWEALQRANGKQDKAPKGDKSEGK
jgi:hypothetical protein